VSTPPLDVIDELVDEGRYAQALVALDEIAGGALARPRSDVVRAELFERVGRLGQAKALLESLHRSKRTTLSEQSTCELTWGRIDWEEGSTGSAVSHIQKAIGLASEASDLRRKCWAQLWLVILIADRSGPSAASPIIAECRQDAIKLGDARVWAALHAFSALMDAQRGLLRSASSHIRQGQELLRRAPNVWLEAFIEFTKTNVAALRSDYRSALGFGHRARELAEKSGAAACLRTSLGNLGFVHYSLGQFDDAIRCFRRALAILPSSGEHHRAMLDTLARIRLAQGSLDECASLLAEIETGITTPDDRLLYSHRYATLTRSQFLTRQGLHSEALDQVDHTLALANEAKDHFLSRAALIEKSHIFQQLNRLPESLETLRSVMGAMPAESPELYAHYEMVLACALASVGQRPLALGHRERAERIFTGLHHKPGLIELWRCWEVAVEASDKDGYVPTDVAVQSTPAFSAASAVQSVAALMTHTGRPELIARGLIDLLAVTGCVSCAAAAMGSPGDTEILASTGHLEGVRPDELPNRLLLGSVHERPVDVWLHPQSDVESTATVNAIALLLSTIHEIERARAEREERLTLWPIEDVPVMNDHAVVNGKMRELMTTSRRIATTNISVLLTGESGTGKEILARAIHTFSDRAEQAFVPFNCAALPRDMLESQLFGHRRGAFTGADRDNPGVIRAARGGTLFLDEIGELSIDLQPKLLRFLESGEICPLGETTPFTVNVRIVAATNAKLEQAVKHGRFREDLFYRLNVVRL
jgi:tetratricopeptide (TPR) repeat protein